jgi:ubiquitin-protein ligase
MKIQMSTLPRSNALRLAKDVREIMKHPLEDNGIYYKHDEENMLQGYACIIGPSETPYQYGFYFFKLEFTTNYPSEPPKVTYFTQGDKIRFHPNLYRSGKVCVSILNTWRGEQWSSCQTISSILLTLTTLFHSKPLLNEPGITEKHMDFEKYNEIVTFKTLEHAILKMADKDFFNKSYHMFAAFGDIVEENLKKNKQEIEKATNRLCEVNKSSASKNLRTNIYSMNVHLNYDVLKSDMDMAMKNY